MEKSKAILFPSTLVEGDKLVLLVYFRLLRTRKCYIQSFSYFAIGNNKMAISGPPEPKMEKVRPVCFFKLKETKWSFFFHFWCLGATPPPLCLRSFKDIFPFFSLFPSTFKVKVEENKLVSLFPF